MKHFMIKYQFANGTTDDWHWEIARFIAALDNDAELKGRIVHRCLKNRDDSGYFHLASAVDDQAVKTLQQRDFFKHYTEKTRQVASGGDVTVRTGDAAGTGLTGDVAAVCHGRLAPALVERLRNLA